jgi:8-oxo-dGTP diphosphatase
VEYVVGFCYSHDLKEVLLLRRNKAPYAEMYNGVGGKVESGETPRKAMFRELLEEVPYITKQDVKVMSWLVTEHFSHNVLNVYAIFLTGGGLCYPKYYDVKEGVLQWFWTDMETWLFRADNPEFAGEGNLAYFMHYGMLRGRELCAEQK